MNNLPGDPGLPPGVTSKDIDERFGDPESERCIVCGAVADLEGGRCARCVEEWTDEKEKNK